MSKAQMAGQAITGLMGFVEKLGIKKALGLASVGGGTFLVVDNANQYFDATVTEPTKAREVGEQDKTIEVSTLAETTLINMQKEYADAEREVMKQALMTEIEAERAALNGKIEFNNFFDGVLGSVLRMIPGVSQWVDNKVDANNEAISIAERGFTKKLSEFEQNIKSPNNVSGRDLGLNTRDTGPSNNLDDQANLNQDFNGNVNNVAQPVGDIRQRLENNGFAAAAPTRALDLAS
jgi:hypothetical protein